MAYTVIARKWRPLLFDDVSGQDHVSITLKNAISNNRIAHAYLFAGPRGVGKTTTARILSKGVNCIEGPTPAPCNKCENCTEITEGRSLDVMEIDGASNRGIDEIRNLRENIRYSSAKGKYRIYIIDEVHMLTKEAFNALLKTLEEPPPNVMFIFATTEPHKVLPTIISRCQRFDFKRISTKDIIARLEYICKEEGIEHDKESLWLIARKADGSMRDGMSLLDQVISFAGEKFEIKDVESVLGMVDKDLYFKLSDYLINKEISAGLELVDTIIKEGYDLIEFLSGLLEHFRNIFILKATENRSLLDISESEIGKLETRAGEFPSEDLLKAINITSESINLIKRSNQPELDFELLIIKLIKMPSSQSIAELLHGVSTGKISPERLPEVLPSEKTTAPEKKKEPEPVSEVNLKTEDTASPDTENLPENLSIDDIKSNWRDVISLIKEVRMGTGSFLEEGEIVDFKENKLEIVFGNKNGFHIDNINKNKELIRDKIKEVCGVKLDFVCKKGNLPDKVEQQKENKSEVLKNIIKNEPVIGEIIKEFNGEVKDVRPNKRRSINEEPDESDV
jgi:DNA polymerase-3 subunit gamma/tau